MPNPLNAPMHPSTFDNYAGDPTAGQDGTVNAWVTYQDWWAIGAVNGWNQMQDMINGLAAL